MAVLVLLDVLEARLSPEEVEELLNLDLLVTGQPRQAERVPEGQKSSWPGDFRTDGYGGCQAGSGTGCASVRRGYFAIPAAAGREATALAEKTAQERHVVLFRDGRTAFWDQTLVQ